MRCLHGVMIVTCFSMLFPIQSFAAHRFHVSTQVGASKLHIGDSTLQVTDTERDTLHQQRNPILPELSFGLGYTLPLSGVNFHSYTWFPAISAALNLRYFKQIVTGDVYQYEEPLMNNYQYSLSVESTRLMLDMMLTLVSFQEKTTLYVLAGLGNAWNKVGYSDSPIPGVEGGALTLNDRTNRGFVYEAGIGLMHTLNQCSALFLEYRYAHFQNFRTATSGVLNGISTEIPSATFPLHSHTISLGINWKI